MWRRSFLQAAVCVASKTILAQKRSHQAASRVTASHAVYHAHEGIWCTLNSGMTLIPQSRHASAETTGADLMPRRAIRM